MSMRDYDAIVWVIFGIALLFALLVTKEYINSKSSLDTVQVAEENIFVDYDSSVINEDKEYTLVLNNSNDYLVGLSFNRDVDYSGRLEDVIELFRSDFIDTASLYSRGDLYGSEIEVISSEKVTVEGFESIRFVGTALNRDWDCHVYGYTFIINDVPCAVIGIVSARAQEPSMIEQLDHMVDQIASTIRTEE